MKKLLIIATVFGLTSSAIAADLTKKVPLPPVRYESSLPSFIGINAGGLYNNDEEYTLGVTVGTSITDHIVGEIAYDHFNDLNANQVASNILLQGSQNVVTPYILGGVGYRWAEQDESVWNIGAGAKVALTDNIDFDARYRHVVGFETDREDDVITGGLIFKF